MCQSRPKSPPDPLDLLFFGLTLQDVEVGLQLRALALFGEASRKADEELQSYAQDCVENSSVVDTYMALANFCDKLLRAEELSSDGR